ncbi:MAG: Pilus assembly protein [Hyphomicrobiales bacterium]|nr:Pilus assembly protein [Hyphomicrobiales bacterium]
MNFTLLILCTMVAASALFYVFIYPYLSGEIAADKRKQALVQGSGKRLSNTRAVDNNQRRKQISDSIKELEKNGKTKKKKVSIEQRLLQAGLTTSKTQFFIMSAVGGTLLGFMLMLITGGILYLGVGMFVGGVGLPLWVLAFLKKRRLTKFSNEFPNALDVIIRGIKAGLPLGDCLRIIATEAVEPVKSEFRLIVESQTVGLTVGEAVERIAERVPVSEAKFFSIVITIQQKAGGNLSEALGNLSRVLRERKKMQLKIKAMSSEAKASAGIIGALPFLVATMVYFSSPKYIELLWITSTGRLVLACCAIWMGIGIAVMKKMIAFDF